MRYTARKILTLLITMAVVSFLTFAAFDLISGDPAATLLGTQATPEKVAALRDEMGLNRPLPVRYGEWLAGFFTGNLGTSFQYRQPVRELLGATGEFSTDAKQGPILAQSWYVLESIRRTVASAGGQMSDVIKLVQYFRNLDHFPYYSRVRKLFYPDQPPVSTVVQVSEMLPDATVLIEVEATVWLPPSFNSEAPR